MLAATLALSLAMLESPFMGDAPAPAPAVLGAPQAMCSPDRVAVAQKAEVRARRVRAVAGLPESYGKSFRTLDAYLVHLECYAAPVDGAWWQEVEPGRFQQMTMMRGAPPVYATRAQLMKRYGFKR